MQQLEKYQALADTLKKETYFSARKIEQQNRLIAFMDEKLTLYELENIKIMDNLGIV